MVNKTKNVRISFYQNNITLEQKEMIIYLVCMLNENWNHSQEEKLEQNRLEMH